MPSTITPNIIIITPTITQAAYALERYSRVHIPSDAINTQLGRRFLALYNRQTNALPELSTLPPQTNLRYLRWGMSNSESVNSNSWNNQIIGTDSMTRCSTLVITNSQTQQQYCVHLTLDDVSRTSTGDSTLLNRIRNQLQLNNININNENTRFHIIQGSSLISETCFEAFRLLNDLNVPDDRIQIHRPRPEILAELDRHIMVGENMVLFQGRLYRATGALQRQLDTMCNNHLNTRR